MGEAGHLGMDWRQLEEGNCRGRRDVRGFEKRLQSNKSHTFRNN
jgi:hypothetical protein